MNAKNPGSAPTKTLSANSNPADHAVFWLKDLMKKHRVNEQAQCSAGCHYCCHQIVSLSIYDAIRVIRGLEEFSDDQRTDAYTQAMVNVEANDAAKADGDRWARRLPCSLLKDKKCSVYDNRPVACIATTSTSKDHCFEQFENLASPQHCPPSVPVKGLTPLAILEYQVAMALPKNKDNTITLSSNFADALALDLDRLVAFYCVPEAEIRKLRLKKLASYDAETIRLLEKRTE